MNFAVKSVVLFFLIAEVFGRTLPLSDGSDNTTEINNFITSGVSPCQIEGEPHREGFFPPGSTFSVAHHPCLVCRCDENWTGSISDSSCYREECEDPPEEKLEEGCFPVYDEKKCCVIDFYCSEKEVPTNEESSDVENDYTSEGSYKVGCPTPLCGYPSCRVGTPPGWSCPTCICEGEKEYPTNEESSDVENDYTSEGSYEVGCPTPLCGYPSCRVGTPPGWSCPTCICNGEKEVPTNEESSEVEYDYTSEGSEEIVCPTPLCAHSSCRIGTPPGWSCPTCICEEAKKEQNELEPSNELSQEEPYGPPNATEDSETFLVPVSWNGDTKEGYVEEPDDKEELNEEDCEAVEVEKPELLKEGNDERELPETTPLDSSINVILEVVSKPNEPRRRRRASPQTGPNEQQQQQGWTVFDEEDEGEREREDDSGEDIGEFTNFGTSESSHGSSKEVSASEEDNVVDVPIAPGCPTPTCEHSGCRIGVLRGHQCPTCICSERRQP